MSLSRSKEKEKVSYDCCEGSTVRCMELFYLLLLTYCIVNYYLLLYVVSVDAMLDIIIHYYFLSRVDMFDSFKLIPTN